MTTAGSTPQLKTVSTVFARTDYRKTVTILAKVCEGLQKQLHALEWFKPLGKR
jgi:hypothetical protein